MKNVYLWLRCRTCDQQGDPHPRLCPFGDVAHLP